jgi:2-polyprenyl-3-methyl-5-hydroxy-6-metoxy-1,4-benzoquinol methylase
MSARRARRATSLSTCVLCSAEVDRRTDLAWHKDGYDIVRCPSCGLVFRAELPDEQELGRIYDEDYFRDRPDQVDRHGYADYLRDEPLHRTNARARLRLLAARTPQRRLLDVGCAAGFFVDEARRAGWSASGIDVSEAMVEWARSRLGLHVTRAVFAAADIGPAPLDAITMWDYIEHSVDPRRDLEKAHEHLRPGGVLVLSTGDIGSLSARVTGRRWHLLTPEHHNYFFSERTLRRLLEATGFEVRETRHRASRYSIAHVLYKLGASHAPRALRRASVRLTGSRLGSTGVPLNLFDIITVVARRV